MAQETFIEKVRDWIGGIGFNVFLWSIRMTADEYLDMVSTVGGLTKRAADCGYACGYQEPYGFVPEAGCPVHDVPHNR